MRSVLIAAVLISSASAVTPVFAQGDDDPFARSRGGAIECYTPDTVNRTCRAMSRYRFEEGRIGNDAMVLIQNNPTIVMYASTTVYARDGMVCGRSDPEEVRAARFTVDGAPAEESVTIQLRQAVQAMVESTGDEVCSRFAPSAEGATAAVIIDGVEHPELVEPVIWIRSEDGYSIGSVDAAPA